MRKTVAVLIVSSSFLFYLVAKAQNIITTTAGSVTFNVPGTSNPYLAGMPDGTICCSGDAAPAQSPVLASGVVLTAGAAITFTNVTGGVRYDPAVSLDSPDGSFYQSSGPTNGIASYVAPIDALVGVSLIRRT